MVKPVLEVKDLRVKFHSDFGDRIVTDDIAFHVDEGETLGIVGESGCGKSVTSLAVMGLLARNGSVEKGTALFDGKDLLQLPEKELDEIRGKDITMVFQDALASLNPVFPVGYQVTEVIRKHLGADKKAASARAQEMLARVGLPDPAKIMKKFPHELSGGQRQRVMIAMALCCDTKLLIADEPTTALDVTIQAQIMQMIRRIVKEMNMSMMLITHDIGLVAQMADRVIVMYAGQIIEEASVTELFRNPGHPYTKALLAAAPGIDDDADRKLVSIRGTVPENYTDLTGCRFMDRCPYAADSCAKHQEMIDCGGHKVRCHLAEKGGEA
ncbi:MAG: ABC transporter ATP-binding protein [Eubacterium sp.]|nr:ABC transporter ATP-binding protein [Eubacterium sp.]